MGAGCQLDARLVFCGSGYCMVCMFCVGTGILDESIMSPPLPLIPIFSLMSAFISRDVDIYSSVGKSVLKS